ncbi:mercuric transporter MerT family protein [Mesorhizobium xinjiangense]|uniref:mercuric transporter MerT family protein n=1 Tax=Mesorhizobium xinjiangense TaxID=2678685 RepID=UPI0012ECC449|nr:mercuric transporter MerT family protein [Mesorhizobium xinjiangense]
MSNADIKSAPLDPPSASVDARKNWFAAGGVIGAILASTCCVAPLVLLTLGISGAWIGNLTALEPYKPIFAGVALVFIGFGFRQVYFRARPACEDGTYCARPESARITKTALWLATVLVVLALTINWWAPFFY